MKNNFQGIAIFTCILIALRCIVEANPLRDRIVSFINIFALLVVVILITERIKKGLISDIKSYHVPLQIERREIRDLSIRLSLRIYIPYAIISILYFLFLSSGLGNDIISIVALGLSLCDDHIVSISVSLCRKKD